jgi:hypothetical protein
MPSGIAPYSRKTTQPRPCPRTLTQPLRGWGPPSPASLKRDFRIGHTQGRPVLPNNILKYPYNMYVATNNLKRL